MALSPPRSRIEETLYKILKKEIPDTSITNDKQTHSRVEELAKGFVTDEKSKSN